MIVTQRNALVVRGLSRIFGDIEAVSDLDLEVPTGAMFGLVGPDGAGKSTVIRLLCGLLKPTRGAVTLLGLDLVRDIGRIKPRIGYLSQNFTLYGDLTVCENIAFFARIHGVREWKGRRDELLSLTGLAPFRDRLGRNLSGGMKKKLALACTLIHTPEMLFLDEPSTGVDPISRGEFWNLLSGMVHNGMTVFLTTPYLDEAERCDSIGLMHRGRIVNAGSPAAIKARMPGRMAAMKCSNPADGYRVLRARWPETRVALQGSVIRFWVRDNDSEIAEAASILERGGHAPVKVEDTVPTLEDAFIALVAETAAQEDAA